jgi:hypothetical protein
MLVVVAAASCRSNSVYSDDFVDTESAAGGGAGGRGSGGRGGGGSGQSTGGAGAGTGGSPVAGGNGGVGGGPGTMNMGGAGGSAADSSPEPGPDVAADQGPAPAPDAPGPTGRALFVVAALPPVGTDITIRDRLAAQMMVEVIADETATPASAEGRSLVVISSSTVMTSLSTQFRDSAVPVMLLEPNLMPVMGLTAAPTTDHGGTPETQLALVGNGHPLHAGLSGTVTVFAAGGRVTWGVPGPAATRIGTLVGRANQVAIFAYDAGATMVGRSAPAKRLAFFIQDNVTENLTPDGVKLLDAAITWLAQ